MTTDETPVARALRQRQERALAQVQREPEAAPAPAATPLPAAPRGPGRPPKPVRPDALVEPGRMLGGRVPDSIFRRFSSLKGEAELTLGVRKITNEQALEAMVRALEDPAVRAAWVEQLRDVHGE